MCVRVCMRVCVVNSVRENASVCVSVRGGETVYSVWSEQRVCVGEAVYTCTCVCGCMYVCVCLCVGVYVTCE